MLSALLSDALATTRALYERRLMKVLQADVVQPEVNGADDTALYSDSEEEGEEEEVVEVENRQDVEDEEASAQEDSGMSK